MVSGYLGQGGWYRYTIDNIPDLHSLVGRAVVLHSDRDHGNGEDCDQSGTSGYRVSAGIIGIQNNDQTMTMFPTVPDNLSFPDGWEPMSCNSSSIDGDEVRLLSSTPNYGDLNQRKLSPFGVLMKL